MRFVLGLTCLLLVIGGFAQKTADQTSEQQVLRVIEDFGRYRIQSDSVLLKSLLQESYSLKRMKMNNGLVQMSNIQLNESEYLKNKQYLFVPQVDIRSDFATVYGYFNAFNKQADKKCGTDYYQLVRINQKWKILQYTETIYINCKSIEPRKKEIEEINHTLNNWHGLAAVGDSTFFDHFSKGSFYLGTDPKEVWSLKEFKDFALPHFRRGSAWNFKNKSRNVHLGDYGHYAWFDEILDTWMGLCRGTGVMEKQSDGWKIKHYSLSILVPNSKINEYIKILNLNE